MLKNAYNRYLHHHELYPLLGLKSGQHLPDEGFGPRQVSHNGSTATFICDPVTDKCRRSPHRIKVACEYCNKFIPFGRFSQHIRACRQKILTARI